MNISNPNNVQILKANIVHLNLILPLFSEYRKFYDAQSKPQEEENFIRERITKSESVIFLAMENDIAVGFTQLYPSFSSLSMNQVWILNDLYVDYSHRKKGIGYMLLDAAKDFAKKNNSKGLTLMTGIENETAQSLYEKFGFIRNEHFYDYFLFF